MGPIQDLTESGMKYYMEIYTGFLSLVMMDIVKPARDCCNSGFLLLLLVFFYADVWLSQKTNFNDSLVS